MPDTPDDAARLAAAKANREKYPEIAEWVDKVRQHFPEARVKSIKPWTDKSVRLMGAINEAQRKAKK